MMILIIFQSLQATADPPNTGASEYDHAKASYGATASASGSASCTPACTPDKAIDTDATNTYWKSSTSTGWIAVARTARSCT